MDALAIVNDSFYYSSYDFSPWSVSNEEKPLHVIYMFQDLFRMHR